MDVVNLASPINVTYNQPVRWCIDGGIPTDYNYLFLQSQSDGTNGNIRCVFWDINANGKLYSGQ